MAETTGESAPKAKKHNKTTSITSDGKSFTNFDIFCVLFSLGTFMADITTDFILVSEYWRKGYLYWSIGTLMLILIPAILIQLFSMRWHLLDEAVSLWHWITHICLLGVLHRYIIMLKTCLVARRSQSQETQQLVLLQHSDICMLHLLESFLEAAPQLLLQLYIMVVGHHCHYFTVISACASLCSLSWAVVSYVRALRRARSDKARPRGPALLLQACWRGALLAARLAALLLFAVGFHHWIFLLLVVHWFGMMAWVIHQKTDFCPSRCEEVVYNCVVGVIYCFCFFNLREGQARHRMAAFYLIMLLQNTACLLLFLFLAEPDSMKHELVVIASGIIIGGTIIGLSSMLIYYRWFHPAGPISWWSEKLVVAGSSPREQHVEPPTHSHTHTSPHNTSASLTLRSLKRRSHDALDNNAPKNEGVSLESSPQSDTECTDKKLLLDHWIARAGSPTFASAPIDKAEAGDVTGIEFYSVNNTPEKSMQDKTGILNASFQMENELLNRSKNESSNDKLGSSNTKSKRRGICSPTELGLKFSKIEHASACSGLPVTNEAFDILAQKRRGICSSNQLEEDINQLKTSDLLVENLQCISDGSSERDQAANSSKQITSSDSINLDLDLSFSDINSSDINEFNENIVQKLCLSTLKNIKNVHQDADIRNIQKIALEILKDLYSKGGAADNQDLESELSCSVGRDLETPSEVLSAHDYENICAVNIAREAWGLRSWRACADMGGSPPPPPLPARRPAPNPHHYIHTIAYELAKCEDSCQLRNTEEYHKPEASLFIAKPYVVDQNGGMFPLTTPLEPILEEIDEIIENNGTMRRRQRHSSESALVATIDEIRNDTVTNSPRNVYHRAEWDSPRLSVTDDKRYIDNMQKVNSSTLRKSLWKDQCAVDKTIQNESGRDDYKLEYESVSYKHGKVLNITNVKNMPSPVSDKSETPKKLTKTKSTCDVGNKHFKTTDYKPKYEKTKKNSNSSIVQYIQKDNNMKNSPRVKICLEKNSYLSHASPQHNSSYEEIIFISRVGSEGDTLPTKSKSQITCNEDVSSFGISSSLQSLIDKDSQTNISMPKVPPDNRTSNKKSSNRPRRKFSLLREKFEPKSKHSDEEMLFQSLESVRSLSTNELDVASSRNNLKNNNSASLLKQETKVNVDKENLGAPTKCIEKTLPEVQLEEAVVLSLAPCDSIQYSDNSSYNLKEKRSIFLKQVLNPPKISNWNKKV